MVTSTTRRGWLRRIVRRRLGRQHHGDIHVAGEVGQPFGVTGIGKAREVERMLVGGSGDDGVDFAAERELGGRLDRVSGDAAGPDGPVAVRDWGRRCPVPRSHRDLAVGRICRRSGRPRRRG